MSIFSIAAMIFGVIVMLGSFIFAAFNMARSQDSDFAFQDGFKKHIGAMVGMACGGAIMVLGGLFGLVEVLRQIFG